MSRQPNKPRIDWTPPQNFLPGDYGGYHLLRQLGGGERSVVWKARSVHHNVFEFVAIKFLFPDESLAALDRYLKNEIDICRHLDDEYICKPWTTLQFDAESGWPPRALVMPYFDTSLRDFLNLFRAKVLSPDKTPIELILKWVIEVSVALDYLHFFFRPKELPSHDQYAWEHEAVSGFVHRDLKPENILLRLPRQRPRSLYSAENFLQARIRLSDLELCSRLGTNPILTRQDRYKDPEMLEAAKAGVYRASADEDIFSMGIIIEELAQCATDGRQNFEELAVECKRNKIGASEIILRAKDIRKKLPLENPMLDQHIHMRISEHETTRRDFLRQARAMIAPLVVPTVIDNATHNFRRYLLPYGLSPDSSSLPFPLNSHFVDRFLVGSQCGLAKGDSNQLRIREGKGDGASAYVNRVFAMFHDVIEQRFKLSAEYRSHTHPLVKFDFKTAANLIMIGGPVANPFVRETNEYDEQVTASGEILPVFREHGCLPFGFFCGRGDYGIWDDGKRRLVRRFENGKEVERHADGKAERGRPLYSIIHRNHGILFGPDDLVDKDGFLRKDFLLITVRPHPEYANQRMISLAGMHGYCLAAFARQYYESFDRLDRITKDFDAFQLLVPARVTHKDAPNESRAELLWDEVEKRDCLVVPNRAEDWRIRLGNSQ